MNKLLVIQNEKQLRAIDTLMRSTIQVDGSSSNILSAEDVEVRFDSESVLYSVPLNIKPLDNQSDELEFVESTFKNPVFKFYPESCTISEVGENNTIFMKEDKGICAPDALTEDERIAQERLFLTLCGFDFSDGWQDEHVIHYTKREPDFAIVVFGHKPEHKSLY